MKIKHLISIGMLLMLIQIMLLIGTLFWFQQAQIERYETLDAIHVQQETLLSININMSRYIKEVVDFVLLGEEELEELDDFQHKADMLLIELERVLSPNSHQFLNSISAFQQQLFAEAEEVIRLHSEGATEEALEWMEEKLEPILDEQFSALLENRITDNEVWLQSANQRMQEQQTTSRIVFFLLTISSLSVLGFIATFAVGSISKRLTVMAAEVDGKSVGQPLGLTEKGNDEIALLAKTLNAYSIQLKEKEQDLVYSREYARNIIENMQDFLLIVDHQGVIKSTNSAVNKQLGYDEQDLPGRLLSSLLTLYDSEFKPVAAHGLVEYFTSHNPLINQMTQIRARDGELRLIQMSSKLQFYVDRKEPEIICVGLDVTERVNAEKQALNEKDKAERASSAKSEFLSSMSHELRTPLNAIIGFSQLMGMDESLQSDVKTAEFIEHISSSGKRLLELVDQILDLNRIEREKITLDITNVRLGRVISETHKQFLPVLKAKNIQFTLDMEQHETSVRADRFRLTQILTNLIDNAIKYNEENGFVVVSTELLADGNVKVSVTDNGIGIAEEDFQRIFEPFERGVLKDRVISGSGVGLAIVKQLVMAMSGEIGLEKDENGFTVFWFTLPLSRQQSLTQKEGDACPEIENITADTSDKLVMYIEDDETNIRLMENVIAMRSNTELMSVKTGKLGFECAIKFRPDLILLDIGLPDVDGYGTLKMLKAHPATKEIPVVAVTAKAMLQDIEYSKAFPFDAYVTKPIELPKFFELVNGFLKE